MSEYLREPQRVINSLYEELLGDQEFLDEINVRIAEVRRHYRQGIFHHEKIDSIDWMSVQRIIQYILVRLYKPAVVVETGVFYGGSTCFLLNGLRRNNQGTLISIDLPGQLWDRERNDSRHMLVGEGEYLPEGLTTGFMVHDNLKSRWKLILGDSHKEIEKLNTVVDFYIHDSEHSFNFIIKEVELMWPKLSKGAIVMMDDLNWSNGFFSFCVAQKVYPLIITDNGKSGLLARTGIAKLDHSFNTKKEVVGDL